MDSPSRLTGGVLDSFSGNVNSVTEAGQVIWENKNVIYDKGGELLKTYVGE